MQHSHATFFVNGNDRKSFTYEPGTNAYYIYVSSGSYHPHTLVIHANSVEHVKNILRNLIEFEKSCIAEYDAAMSGEYNYIAKKQRTELMEQQLDDGSLEIEELNRGMILTLNPYGAI